jgi:hypothetical protein
MKADCIRAVTNWSRYPEEKYRFDSHVFDAEAFAQAMPVASPKLKALIDNIAALDEADRREHGHAFKHCIYVDSTSSILGAPLVAAALVASGQFVAAFDRQMKLDEAHLKLHTGQCFALVCSGQLYGQSYPVRFRRSVLKAFNQRPDNVHGANIRIVIIDGGFREGIDLFDTRYCHLFDLAETEAGEKQVVGRNTRFCGQSGLTFDAVRGWPLKVLRYTVKLPQDLAEKLQAKDMFELYLKAKGVDVSSAIFAHALEKLTIYGAVDHELTTSVHAFSIDESPTLLVGGKRKRPKKTLRELVPKSKMNFDEMRLHIKHFEKKFAWPKAEMKNLCENKAQDQNRAELNPTQKFCKDYFRPESAYKGLLLWLSTGAGKTCSAIATATASWEKKYNILWVTRHTLKTDIWKNMFQTSCSETLKKPLQDIPLDAADHPYDYISNKWITPISFRQFSNMLAGKNKLYHSLVALNGQVDLLKNTLVIIDEVHKLYDGSLDRKEQPDTDVLMQRIHSSYSQSGNNSVRLLLMTATPFGNNPMDLIRILNLMRESDDQLPVDFGEFSKRFLAENRYFTETGTKEYLDAITGYIVYLNREKDARQFAYPVYNTIEVPLSRSNRPQLQIEIAALREQVQKFTEYEAKSEDLKRAVTQKTRDDTKRFLTACRSARDAVAKKSCTAEVVNHYQHLGQKLKHELNDKIAEYDAKKAESQWTAKEIRRKLERDISQEAALMDRCEIPEQMAGMQSSRGVAAWVAINSSDPGRKAVIQMAHKAPNVVKQVVAAASTALHEASEANAGISPPKKLNKPVSPTVRNYGKKPGARSRHS